MSFSKPITVPCIIDGKDMHCSSTFPVANPSTGEICWDVANASEDDARKAVDVAQAAFPTWAASKPLDRQAILFKAADLMEERASELVNLMCTEMGTDEFIARQLIVGSGIAMMKEIACRIWEVCGSVPVPVEPGQSRMVWKEPYGVVLGIVPWSVYPNHSHHFYE